MSGGFRSWAAGLALAAVGCGASGGAGPAMAERRAAAVPAVEALRKGDFAAAGERAEGQIAKDAGNPEARLVRAVVRYEKSMHQLNLDVRSLIGGAAQGGLNHKRLRTALEEAEASLAEVDTDLAAAAADTDLAVELCLACWEMDWTGDGRIDDRDRRLFEIEEDEHGERLPEGDPRRRPTFRFDAGDVSWARAFVSFQRAAADVLVAYDYSDLDRLLGERSRRGGKIVLRLRDKGRITAARALILQGLDHSDAARRAYLAETDDDREWVPSPRQKSHPMPLPVDQALYDTWEGVLGDVRRLVEGDEGVAVADLVSLVDGKHGKAPTGLIDVGSMLSRPRDITLDMEKIERAERFDDMEAVLRGLLGDHYVADMKPSPLPRRLLRMKGEIERSEEGLSRKLRYFFWLN